MTDYLIVGDQKIPDWFIMITFLVKTEAAISLGIQSRFGIMGFSTSDAIWGMRFFSLTPLSRSTI